MVSMGKCLCCGETTKSDTAQFLPGHDAKYKSQLIARVIESEDDEALGVIESRGWTKFLDKARNNRSKKKIQREQAKKDGLPMNAIRITPEMDEDEVATAIVNRKIVVRYELRGMDVEETIEVGRIRLVAEGEIDFWIKDYTKKGEPMTNQCRTVKAEQIVGILNK